VTYRQAVCLFTYPPHSPFYSLIHPPTYLSNMAPRTPSPRSRRQEADTILKARFFHAIDTRQSKSVKTTTKEEEISHATGFHWLRERRVLNSSAHRRIGKHRIDRPSKLTEELLQRLVDPVTNRVRDQVLEAQLAHHQLPFSLRTLRAHCAKHKPRILMGRRPAIKLISSANKKARVQYDNDYKSKTMKSFWQYVIFYRRSTC